MKEKRYREYLKEQNFKPEAVEKAVEFLKYFNNFIKAKKSYLDVDSVSTDIYRIFVDDVIKNKMDTYDDLPPKNLTFPPKTDPNIMLVFDI